MYTILAEYFLQKIPSVTLALTSNKLRFKIKKKRDKMKQVIKTKPK